MATSHASARARLRPAGAAAVLALVSALLLLAGGGGRSQAAGPTPNGYTLGLFATAPELNLIVDLAVIPGHEDEAIVATLKDELLWRISLTGAFPPALYGDLTAFAGGLDLEEGLLSVAFSPQFESDGRVYVYYTRGSPLPSVVARFQATATDLDEGTAQVVLEVPQPNSNHNGGRLLFGPDGYLYLSLGDGGGGGDPDETGQDNTDLLGSVLRLAVTGQTTYSVPPDNPFVGLPGADEVWAYGMRNPWRYSFDRLTGKLWLGDVGQNAWEEVEEVVKGGNYGWDCYEGFAVYEPTGCPGSGFQFPRAVYSHAFGCSVTGGYVYRGSALPELYGWYVYGDYCSGRVWAVNPADSSNPVQLMDSTHSISSFAELPDGELLVLTFEDAIYRLECSAAVDTDSDGRGNACDNDDDGDGYWDGDEETKGSQPLIVGSVPEHCDGADNDGDTTLDEAPALSGRATPDPLCAPGADPDGDTVTNGTDTDDDNDGFSDADERSMSTDELDDCRVVAGHDAWPPDANSNGTANVGDVILLFGGGRVLQDAGDPYYSRRSDAEGNGAVNVGDVIALFGGGNILTAC